MHAAYVAAMEAAEYRRSPVPAPAPEPEPVDTRPLPEIAEELNSICEGITFEVEDGVKLVAYIANKPLKIVCPRAVTVDKVVMERLFSSRATFSVPFTVPVSRLGGIKVYNMYRFADGETRTLYIKEVDTIRAHQCYMMFPESDNTQIAIDGKVTIEPTTEAIYSNTIGDGVYTHAVFSKKRWEQRSDKNPDGENADELGHVYGISASNTDTGIHVGDLVKVGSRVAIYPCRFYIYFDEEPAAGKMEIVIG